MPRRMRYSRLCERDVRLLFKVKGAQRGVARMRRRSASRRRWAAIWNSISKVDLQSRHPPQPDPRGFDAQVDTSLSQTFARLRSSRGCHRPRLVDDSDGQVEVPPDGSRVVGHVRVGRVVSVAVARKERAAVDGDTYVVRTVR